MERKGAQETALNSIRGSERRASGNVPTPEPAEQASQLQAHTFPEVEFSAVGVEQGKK